MAVTVAVIGGGLTGCLIAIELAEAGHDVQLHEKGAALMRRASLANEGKIHLGYVYAADHSFRTAERMIEDALIFRPVLERWITPAAFEACVYDRFEYVVPQASTLTPDEVGAHFERIDRYLALRCGEQGQSYLGQEGPLTCQSLSPGRNHLTRIDTPERGVWPERLSDLVEEVVRAHPRITLRLGSGVARARPEGGGWRLDLATGRGDGPYGAVVNAAWADRRHIDRNSGFASAHEWFVRYKYGVVLHGARAAFGGGSPPSITAISGPFGDSVYDRRSDALYVSWYPTCMIYSTSGAFADRAAPDVADPEAAARAAWRGLATVDARFEVLADLAGPLHVRIKGDFITALGRSDIDDPASRLHQRATHGAIRQARGYWSVETGKYTSVARCAVECAQGVLAEL